MHSAQLFALAIFAANHPNQPSELLPPQSAQRLDLLRRAFDCLDQPSPTAVQSLLDALSRLRWTRQEFVNVFRVLFAVRYPTELFAPRVDGVGEMTTSFSTALGDDSTNASTPLNAATTTRCQPDLISVIDLHRHRLTPSQSLTDLYLPVNLPDSITAIPGQLSLPVLSSYFSSSLFNVLWMRTTSRAQIDSWLSSLQRRAPQPMDGLPEFIYVAPQESEAIPGHALFDFLCDILSSDPLHAIFNCLCRSSFVSYHEHCLRSLHLLWQQIQQQSQPQRTFFEWFSLHRAAVAQGQDAPKPHDIRELLDRQYLRRDDFDCFAAGLYHPSYQRS